MIFGAFETEAYTSTHRSSEALLWHIQMVAVGITVGIVFGLAIGLAARIASGIAAGITLGIAVGITLGIAFGIAFGITERVAIGVAIGGAAGVAGGIVGGTAFGVFVGTLAGILIGTIAGIPVGILIGALVGVLSWTALFRAYYQPLQPFFVWPKVRGHWYPYHPVAWDDCCRLTFPGLDRLLVDYYEREPKAAQREIARLIDAYPSQRFQAQRASAILVARRASQTRDLSRLDEIVAMLPEGDRDFLAQTRRLREMIHEICSLQVRLDTLDRPFLKEPWTRLLRQEIERFREGVAGFHSPLAQEFGTAANNWLPIAREQHAEATAVLEKEPTRQVFRAGDPVDCDREAFVLRTAVSGQIERQVMLATGCPGIVLYGRGRTGKSTVLKNLDVFLPASVLRTDVVSMQKPDAFTSIDRFVDTLTSTLRQALVGLDLAGGANDLSYLFCILEAANCKLHNADQRLLFSIDEYEYIDRKIGEGVFPRDLLATLRESIQTHRRITWIFAGRHEIAELRNAPWSSYLVSARTIEVGLFTPSETRLLLTEPLKYSSLWPKDDPARPHFEPGFWGEGGIERIHTEAGGWPHLVQLITETTIDLLNDDRRTSVDAKLLERALEQAIVRGRAVFHELMRRESTRPGEWDYLTGFRTATTQPPPADEAVARSLRRRLLVSEENELWRLRAPLMGRWLREQG